MKHLIFKNEKAFHFYSCGSPRWCQIYKMCHHIHPESCDSAAISSLRLARTFVAYNYEAEFSIWKQPRCFRGREESNLIVLVLPWQPPCPVLQSGLDSNVELAGTLRIF